MTTTGSWTGWRSHDSGRSSYNIGLHTSLDVGSAEAKLVDYVDGLNSERVTAQIVNEADTAETIQFYTTEMASPNQTFDSTEWDQEPDSSTSYSVGSHARVKKSLVGPIRWLAVTAYHSTVTSTGSNECTFNQLA